MAATLWRKKPVEVWAMQWDGTTSGALHIIAWSKGFNNARDIIAVHEDLVIRTLEGDMTVSPGDYVIRGIKGEFYPCKPDIFEETYEAVM